MPTPTGGDDESTSQNQGGPLANGQQPGKVHPKRDPVLSARDELLARMDEQITTEREDMDQEAIASGDTRTAMVKAELQRESAGQRIRTDRQQGRPAPVDADPDTQDGYSGSDPYEEVTDPEPARQVARATQPDNRGVDPLADFIVREAGRPPMFRAMVDGEVRLIPLDQARAALQKHVAADVRIQRATQREQALNAREQALRTAEQRQNVRPAAVPIDDATLETEAQELVQSLINEPPAKAAAKMKTVLGKLRASMPQMDPNVLVRQATDLAKKEIAAENTNRALVAGLSQFDTDYPDIVGDPDLYNLADNKTDAISKAHPDWTPSQIMSEAGEQVREWVGKLNGKGYQRPRGQQRLAVVNGGRTTVQNNRQQAKSNLKPMPQARSARPAQGQDPNASESPQDAIDEIKRSRGQVV